MKTNYTVVERAQIIYRSVTEVCDVNRASEIMTPLEAVHQQLSDVPLAGKICVPGAGVGTYVLALIQLGVDPSNITAVELDYRYCSLGAGIFERFGVTYVHADFLSWDSSVKFDVIVGNPPYSLPKGYKAISDGTKNLSLRFIERSVELLNDGGYISMVTPLNFLKPTDSVKPTRSFSVLSGTSLVSVQTGVEKKWFPGIGTKIAFWCAKKENTGVPFKLNGVPWDITSIPFIVDLDKEELQVFKSIWKRMKTGDNPVTCIRVKDGNKLPSKGWSLTERVNRRYGNEFVIPWSAEPVREKYEQVHISLEPNTARKLFSQPHVRFFVKATSIEPTVYHNLFDGLDYGPQDLSGQELQVIEGFLKK